MNTGGSPIVQLYRDPVARLTVVRRSVPSRTQPCAWCGQQLHHRMLFQYGVQPDSISGRIHWLIMHFCTIGCARSYYPELPGPQQRR